MSFDPFTATMEEAQAQPDALALAQWGNAQLLTIGRARYEGDPLAGVHLCARYGLLMPDWLADAYCRAYERVKGAEVASWDEAFGAPWPKGTQLARERHHNRVRPAIFRDVTMALANDPSTALDDELFERVGKAHGVAKTLARRLYAEACTQMGYGGAHTARAIRRDVKGQATNFRKLAAIRRKR